MNKSPGIFVISLDFELYWGMRDVLEIKNYEENIKGEYTAIPKILKIFQEFDIHATWAIVGFLFFENQYALMKNIPSALPNYSNENFSPYVYLQKNLSQLAPEYHFAPKLIHQIRQIPGQEIGTHTFSHYYCLESGQDQKTFAADIGAAVRIAHRFGLNLKSIVFPRNQFNRDYLNILGSYQIQAYRGNEDHWLYNAIHFQESNKIKRLLRFIDTYINLSGHHCHALHKLKDGKLINIPASRFLRPYHPRFHLFEKLRLRRIKKAMSIAAKQGKLYHLWWHPHNFGIHTDKNISFLKQILLHFKKLQKHYQMQNMNMEEVCKIFE